MTNHLRAVREALAGIPHAAMCRVLHDNSDLESEYWDPNPVCTCDRDERIAAAVVRYGEAWAVMGLSYPSALSAAAALAALKEE